MFDVKQLNKTYLGAVKAICDVSLSIQPGVFGLLGPNGAGKSTLMRILATLQQPDSGSVQLDGIDIAKNARDARRLIGYLPQDMGVYPRVTAREMLAYIAGLKGFGPKANRNQLVDQQLEKVNLSDHAHKRLDTFSGGMKRRFGIAAALLGNPRLVIVDEPTAGLDPLERRRFQLMLTEAAQDCVMLLSSHIVEDIAGLCDDMALMNEGRILLRGVPQQLTDSLGGKVWEFHTKIGNHESIHENHRVLSWQPDSGKLKVRVWAETRGDLSVPDAKPVDANLEDLYAFHVA